MTAKLFLVAGSAFGFLGVALGAMGAHALKDAFEAEPKRGEWFELGVRYAFYHALALLLVGLLWDRLHTTAASVSGYGFLVGTCVFSGTLLVMGGTGVTKPGGVPLGAITPLGGLAFLVGWAALATAVLLHAPGETGP